MLRHRALDGPIDHDLQGLLNRYRLQGDENEARAVLELARARDPDIVDDLRQHVVDDIADMEASLELVPGTLVSLDALRAAGMLD